MPRGVYDRSKLKKNKGAEKKAESTETVAKVAAPKGKPGRKPGSKNKVQKTSAPAVHLAEAAPGMAQVQKSYSELYLISEVRNNLATLSLIADKFGTSVPGVQDEMATQVGYLTRLSKDVFGIAEAAPAAADAEDEEETKAEQQAAPSNGVSTQSYPTTVPMPPSPVTVPSIPSH